MPQGHAQGSAPRRRRPRARPGERPPRVRGDAPWRGAPCDPTGPARRRAVSGRPASLDSCERVVLSRARPERADEVGDARDVVALAPRSELPDESARERGIAEVRGPDLDRVRARDEKLDDVLDGDRTSAVE